MLPSNEQICFLQLLMVVTCLYQQLNAGMKVAMQLVVNKQIINNSLDIIIADVLIHYTIRCCIYQYA